MDEAIVDGRGDYLPTPLYLAQQFTGRIDVAALLQPPRHAGDDRGIDVGNIPRHDAICSGHIERRRDQGEAVDDADDLRVRSTGDLLHLRKCQPRFAQPLELVLDLFRPKLNEMAQPVIADATVTFLCRRIVLSAGSRDLILGNGLKCAFRLNDGRNIDQANQLALCRRPEEIPPATIRRLRQRGC